MDIQCSSSTYTKTSDIVDVLRVFDELGLETQETCKKSNDFLSKPIMLPDGLELDDKAYQIIRNKSAGKSIFGINLISIIQSKKKLKEIKILSVNNDLVHSY